MTEQKEVCQFFANGPIYNIHDAILQTCDRFLGWDMNGNRQYYPSDVYEAALETVENARIIYSPTGAHADPYAYEVDPEKAISDIGGRTSGKIMQPFVDKTGHPTTRGKLAIEPDPEIEKLIAEGHLSLSPSIWSTYDENGNVTKIRFQNLIIFPDIPGGPAVPGDMGTIILNSKPNPDYGASSTNDVNPIQDNTGKTMNEQIEKPVIDPAVTAQLQELAQQFSTFKTGLETAKAETEGLKAQLAAKDDELKAEKEAFAQFTAKLEEDKAKAKEAEFQGLIHDPLFPEGLLKAENAEELLRTEFNTSPAQFTRRILTVYVTQGKLLGEKGQEQGQQFSQQKSESKWDSDEGKLLLEKFGLKREQMEA